MLNYLQQSQYIAETSVFASKTPVLSMFQNTRRAMSSFGCDYIILRAGSAICVLANRLTEDATVRVLLIKAGGSGKSLFIRMSLETVFCSENQRTFRDR